MTDHANIEKMTKMMMIALASIVAFPQMNWISIWFSAANMTAGKFIVFLLALFFYKRSRNMQKLFLNSAVF